MVCFHIIDGALEDPMLQLPYRMCEGLPTEHHTESEQVSIVDQEHVLTEECVIMQLVLLNLLAVGVNYSDVNSWLITDFISSLGAAVLHTETRHAVKRVDRASASGVVNSHKPSRGAPLIQLPHR